MILVFDAETGAPAALLLDHGAITHLMTGAAGAVAAKHLARADAWSAWSGAASRRAIRLRRSTWSGPLREVRIWGRRSERARARAAELASRPGMAERCRFVAVDSVREAVEGADMVVTVTPSREPLVRAEWIARGTHVTAVGSDGPEKRELFPEVLARADRVVADSKEQCLRLGEIHHAVASGVLAENDVDAELGWSWSGHARRGAPNASRSDLPGPTFSGDRESLFGPRPDSPCGRAA